VLPLCQWSQPDKPVPNTFKVMTARLHPLENEVLGNCLPGKIRQWIEKSRVRSVHLLKACGWLAWISQQNNSHEMPFRE